MTEAVDTQFGDLHVRVLGAGEPLILLHGWGMHSSMLEDVALEISKHFRVMLVDLPGHGKSTDREFTLDSISRDLAQLVDGPAHWLGWSLGGSIVMNLAIHYPQRVRSLVLVSATPRFVRGDHWDCAVAAPVLDRFAQELATDYAATMKRFLLLQTLGSEQAKAGFKSLQEKLGSVPIPDKAALNSGLEILRNTDLRREISGLPFPVQVILGERDTLVPGEVSTFYRERLRDAQVHVIPGAGHVPFVSHRQDFLRLLQQHVKQILAA